MLGLIPREEFRSKRLKGPAIEANYQMMDGGLVIDMRTPFVGYAL